MRNQTRIPFTASAYIILSYTETFFKSKYNFFLVSLEAVLVSAVIVVLKAVWRKIYCILY